MIDNPSSDPTAIQGRRAHPLPFDAEDVLSSVSLEPEQLEPGLRLLGRSVDLGGGMRAPLLFRDAQGCPLVVLAAPNDDALLLFRVVESFRRLRSQMPVFRALALDAAEGRHEDARPRVAVLAPCDTTLAERAERLALLAPIPATLYACQRLRLDEGRELVAIRIAGGDPPETGRDPVDDRVTRLAADARARILRLGPEVVATEDHDGTRFEYRGRELARLVHTERGLRVITPRQPEGQLALGRTDLDGALHAVIEEFFALYARAGSEVAGGGPASAAPGVGPATLTREEIDEFLKPDDEP